MAAQLPFRYEIEMSDQQSTIKCHGKVVSETAGELKDLVKPLIPKCRRIVLDLTDVAHLDSSGLGTLVGLKISATAAADCRLEFINLSPRVQELLHITKLTQLFKSFTIESHTPPAADKESRPKSLSEVAEEAAVEGGEPEASTEWRRHTPAATEEEEPESLSVAEGVHIEEDGSEATTESRAPIPAAEELEPESFSVVLKEIDVDEGEPEVTTHTRESAADESRKRAASQKTANKIVQKTVKKAAKKQAKKSAKKKTGKKDARSRRS